MLKDRKIKKLLKRTLFPVLTLVNRMTPKKENYILLYSANGGIRHNLKPLMEYLLENKYDSKYKIICGIENMKYADDNNTRVIYANRIKSIGWFLKSKYVFYTTGQIPIKPSKKQIVVHLFHGAAHFKACGKLSKIGNGEEFYFTYYMAPSEIYGKITVAEYGCSEENVLINGEPMTDVFYKETSPYKLGNYHKVGLWAPTFRQSDILGYDDSSEELLPMFQPEHYEELNERLKEYGIKLIVKLHAGQTLTEYSTQSFSHLELLSDTDFTARGYSLYPLLKQVDFLIADYSSVFLQFLLFDKPIGFAVPDFEEYAQKRGFVFKNPLDYMPGDIMKNKEHMYRFLENMAEGRDDYAEKRHRVCDIIHTYRDGNNTSRVLEMSGIRL